MIVFVSNFFNHHQEPLAEELFRLTNGEYRFVELEVMPDSFKSAGYPGYEDSAMLIKAWADPDRATRVILDADVVLYGNITDYSLIRQRLDRGKLTFEVGERWLKRGIINALSPRLIKSLWYYHRYFSRKPLYRLCASAFAAADLRKFGAFRGKCFKWGYFTAVSDLDVDKVLELRRAEPGIRLMSIARFIPWKHHELAVRCMRNLVDKGYDAELDIYGSGPEFDKINSMVEDLGLESRVHLKGNMDNRLLLGEIRKHDIMLFTSDRNEGWGAVINEAMANACPVVGSDAVGSVPFLIQNGYNGLIFKSGNADDLTIKVETLITNPELREQMSRRAYITLRDEWSPVSAAKRLLVLIDCLRTGNPSPFTDGPCSPTN